MNLYQKFENQYTTLQREACDRGDEITQENSEFLATQILRGLNNQVPVSEFVNFERRISELLKIEGEIVQEKGLAREILKKALAMEDNEVRSQEVKFVVNQCNDYCQKMSKRISEI